MQRVLGGILIVLGSVGLASLVNCEQYAGVNLLYKMGQVLETIEHQIVREKNSLPEIFSYMKTHSGGPFCTGFSNTEQMLLQEKEVNPLQAYRDCMVRALADYGVGEEEKELFANALSGCDGMWGETSVGSIQYAKDRIVNLAKTKESEYQNRKELIRRIGIASGVFLTLIFI